MTSLKHPPMERTVGGSIPATDEFYTRHLRMVNGGNVPTRTDNVHATVSTGVPKMGVRARVADWPPRKDMTGAPWLFTAEPENSAVPSGGKVHIKLGSIMSPQDSSMLRNIHNTLKNRAQANNYSPETRYLAPGDYRGPAYRNPRQRRIRQRSNSDMTISEMEGSGDSGEDWGPALGAKWSPLHREYGSTSSIDQHGASGESFFEMLKGYQGDKVDQRSPAPEKLEDMLNVGSRQTIMDLQDEVDSQPPKAKDRDKPPKRRTKSETGGESIFRKLRNVRGELDSPRAGSDVEDSRTEDMGPPLKPWVCQKGFSHYDVQSTLFDLNEIIQLRQTADKRKNTTTGASAAAVASATSTLSSTHSLPYSSPSGSQEELSSRDSPSLEAGDEQSNEMLLSCPCFRNEIGADGNGRRRLGAGGMGYHGLVGGGTGNSGSGTLSGEGNLYETSVSTHCTNAGVAVLEGPKEGPSTLSEKGKQYIVEHVDLGAYYYRKFFYLREHWNYFGIDETLGPMAVSLRREKLDEDKEHGQQYNYRLIYRTSELSTLRGSILEDAVPSTSKHGTTRGLPIKEVLEYLLPELDLSCLRLALNTPKVTEQLMKLDEQGLSFQVKVGVMYCRAGQSTEEEMYNNETAGPALEEFLQLLGEKVRLKGFTKYRAQLDTKTDSTGNHSLYTSYKDYEIMFHVSTLLPYTPNNKQQLLRKRHVGNDIVTIVFQEPGAHPFTPKAIRSHFQHVFIIVRVHNPCSDTTCYSVAVTRSQDVPIFGPPIPKGVTFPKSTVFRDFLLAKVINAENAAHKSDKFGAMATRTRQEYLRDLAERHVTTTPLEPTGKFPFISLAHKRREKVRPYSGGELRSLGAVTWQVHAEDQVAGAERECLLAISNDFIILLDQEAKAVVFNCATRDVIGWSTGSPASMKIYYERGESVSLRSINNNTEDFGEVVKRLELLTKGCQTTEMTLRRNALGQLGFHVNFEGIVAEVEPYGYAWQAGLRQGSRLVEICKVSVASLSHEQMIDLLRTSVTVKVVIIPPHEDSTPRRGCSEIYHMPLVDYKNHKEGMPYELKFPFRPTTNNNTKWPRTSSSPQTRAAGTGGTLIKAPPPDLSDRNSAVIPRSVSSDGRPLNPKRYSPGNDNYALACSIVMGRTLHNTNSPSNLSYPDTMSSTNWRQKSAPDGFNNNNIQSPVSSARQAAGDGANGIKVCSSTGVGWSRTGEVDASRQGDKANADTGVPKVVIPRLQLAEQSSHMSPNKSTKLDAPYSSSQSSSNTLSSNASSSAHSDEKWYEVSSRSGVRSDLELNGYLQGASTDSGIDATSFTATQSSTSSSTGAFRAKDKIPWQDDTAGSQRVTDSSPPNPDSLVAVGGSDVPAKSPTAFPLVPDDGSNSLNDATSHSSSGHSGSPMGHGCSPESPQDETAEAGTSSTSQNPQSPGTKSFYPRQGATSKYLIGWRKPGGTVNSVDFGNTRKRHQSDGLLGGQPQLRANLRGSQSPQRHTAKSSLEEDLKKLITLDSPPPTTSDEKPLFPGPPPSRRSLQRTLSDESIYSGQREPSSSGQRDTPTDLLFSCSTIPRSPTSRQGPTRRVSHKSLGDLSATETSELELEKKRQQLQDPALMPLPDNGADGPLDWAHLVDAAKAFEEQRLVYLAAQEENSMADSAAATSPQQAEPQAAPLRQPSPGEIPACMMGKVGQLESMVKALQEDLKKEKDAKVSLQAQIQSLREDNQRLLEESYSASAKLKKFTEWVFNTIDMN
ncbi:signal-induced proliferation-associated 1-like protein 1 [Hippoglossus hippoglossus]|uniref:signal-induced proliferation-associated 1-like protein 1 n=1 Tax=Hippoglossus hippoglossus TaxID=8267 RepID=UPI00148CA24B|nr:signal-induced proliferation-associated 1-like protein 1 [Hippoglossus hippoglossus]XP_034431485.1 signal-induced proliferation-associated 1-like protein 1 [Hippoglossus hippoglossus]XP_034431486.1 signal-induced proliferation-associated 1-like protein 1 [Hippoglossus hippoglossus]XP_034431487.1 signal-induced proliferation-associated 1-like protein 1 [Hippoglossus hippoglossus]XP_034431488.1 signal-induced proliferation-associated 1-like protein 1 [Hippoglossus hippoglossus]